MKELLKERMIMNLTSKYSIRKSRIKEWGLNDRLHNLEALKTEEPSRLGEDYKKTVLRVRIT